MASTRDIVQAVVERLRARIVAVAVELYPENPNTWRLNHPIAALLVDYRASRYGPTRATDAVLQGRVLSLGVSIVARSLHDAAGALAQVDAVRLALLGFALPDCGRLSLESERFVSGEAGVWVYESVFQCASTVVQELQDDTAVVLRRATAEDGWGMDEIEPEVME